MNEYLEKFVNETEANHALFERLREYATKNKVPIIKRESLVAINCLLSLKNAKRVLEIGTAIGYSALSFVSAKADLVVDTIERDESMYNEAIKNIKEFGLVDKVNVYFGDALTLDLSMLKTYDAIFIDAAKAQYKKFFDRYLPFLKEDGIVITDNILFHGCVENPQLLSKNVLGMVKKIDAYNHSLNSLEGFDTFYLDLGDGLTVTMRKKKCN